MVLPIKPTLHRDQSIKKDLRPHAVLSETARYFPGQIDYNGYLQVHVPNTFSRHFSPIYTNWFPGPALESTELQAPPAVPTSVGSRRLMRSEAEPREQCISWQIQEARTKYSDEEREVSFLLRFKTEIDGNKGSTNDVLESCFAFHGLVSYLSSTLRLANSWADQFVAQPIAARLPAIGFLRNGNSSIAHRTLLRVPQQRRSKVKGRTARGLTDGHAKRGRYRTGDHTRQC